MNDINEILEFVTHLGKEMIMCGANLERVNMAIIKLCHRYRLHEVSLHTLNTSLTVAAKDEEGNYAVRQLSVPSFGINLDMLRKLNNLSYNVAADRPPSSQLMDMLKKTVDERKYPWWLSYIGYIGAMSFLCRIFLGSWQDIIVEILNTSILFFLTMGVSRLHINKVITNFVFLFITTFVTLFFVYIGFAQSFYSIIITSAFFLMPGIPMVNAVRNIFCENELNGIKGLIKVIIEVLALVAGLAAAYSILDAHNWNPTEIEDTLFARGSETILIIELIVLSALASFSFGIVFKMGIKDWVFAGVGGALVRIVYVFFIGNTEYRIVYTVVAAFVAALYAEITAIIKKEPGTIYLYPSIIPLIPGDLLYYTVLGVVWDNSDLRLIAIECVVQLVALSVGFVICSTVIHYIRKIRLKRIIEAFENSYSPRL